VEPHADALTYLILRRGGFSRYPANPSTAEQRGLAEKAKALNASLERLKAQTGLVAKALQS
jgi:hypothetical protein